MLQLRAAQAFGRVLMTGCLEDDAPSLNDLISLLNLVANVCFIHTFSTALSHQYNKGWLWFSEMQARGCRH